MCRAFRQRGEDQIVTLFGVAAVDGAGTGHYRVGSAGDFDATGWGVSVSRNVAEGTRASIDYSRAGAEWIGRSPDFWALARLASQVLRRSDVVHDLTATIESLVPATSTRVFVLYKLNSPLAAPGFEQASAGGARFDVQINQALPFQRREVALGGARRREEHVPRRVRRRLAVRRAAGGAGADARARRDHRQVLGRSDAVAVSGRLHRWPPFFSRIFRLHFIECPLLIVGFPIVLSAS